MSATSAKVTSSVDATIGPRASPSLGACLSFGVGTIGTAVLLNTVTVYLPAFMTTVLGRSAALRESCSRPRSSTISSATSPLASPATAPAHASAAAVPICWPAPCSGPSPSA